jgi:hypothetical protein
MRIPLSTSFFKSLRSDRGFTSLLHLRQVSGKPIHEVLGPPRQVHVLLRDNLAIKFSFFSLVQPLRFFSRAAALVLDMGASV